MSQTKYCLAICLKGMAKITKILGRGRRRDLAKKSSLQLYEWDTLFSGTACNLMYRFRHRVAYCFHLQGRTRTGTVPAVWIPFLKGSNKTRQVPGGGRSPNLKLCCLRKATLQYSVTCGTPLAADLWTGSELHNSLQVSQHAGWGT
jgi:hypothetical protein